jgi:hypothetical protein
MACPLVEESPEAHALFDYLYDLTHSGAWRHKGKDVWIEWQRR